MSVNKVILIGNLGKDPDVRQTNSGLSVCNLRIATNERVKKGDEWQDHTEWHSVVLFGKTAETAGRFLHKGKQVYIEGRLRTTSYEKDGVEKWSTEIVCDNMRLIGSKGDDAGGGQSNGGSYGGGRGGSYGGGGDSGVPF
mgnify:FL=1